MQSIRIEKDLSYPFERILTKIVFPWELSRTALFYLHLCLQCFGWWIRMYHWCQHFFLVIFVVCLLTPCLHFFASLGHFLTGFRLCSPGMAPEASWSCILSCPRMWPKSVTPFTWIVLIAEEKEALWVFVFLWRFLTEGSLKWLEIAGVTEVTDCNQSYVQDLVSLIEEGHCPWLTLALMFTLCSSSTVVRLISLHPTLWT